MPGLLEKLRARIRAEGPISVAEYMQACLADPEHGYYMQRDAFGAKGDFITAPEISQIFGELLGAWVAQGWLQMGAPAKLALVELGPGRGTLMKDVLRATRHVPGFHAALSIHLVETSPRLRDIQRNALSDFRLPCFWHDDVMSLPAKPSLILANEFFDALPIEQTVRDIDGKAQTRRVGLQGEDLYFLPEGPVWQEFCPAAEGIMQHLSAHLLAQHGAALIIDYGYATPPKTGAADTLQAVRNHAYADVFDQPGFADLTAHVDFSSLAQIAERQGLRAWGTIGQGMFLDRLGGEIRLNQLLQKAEDKQRDALISGWRRLISPNAMGTLFKALAIVPREWDSVAGFDMQPVPMKESE